jgi:valyl-tRNA synthetase
MADTVYHFVWDQFCDWYLELIKPAFVDGEKQDMDAESKTVAGWVLDQILVMLHPFMPFITEELWHALADPAHPRKYDLIHAKWPEPKADVDVEANAQTELLKEVIGEVRSTRTDFSIPWKQVLPLFCPQLLNDNLQDPFSLGALERMAKVRPTRLEPSPANQAMIDDGDPEVAVGDNRLWASLGKGVQVSITGFSCSLGVWEGIDLDAERARITKAIEAATKERDALAGRLSNAAFVEKAKPEAVEKARADYAEKAAEAERLGAALDRLG